MTKVLHKFLIYLTICFCLKCLGLSFSQSSVAGVQFCQWFNPPEYAVSARVLTVYSGGLNHRQICTSVYEDGLKERPKHVR
jgi:preprotein translocase subunit SecG